MDLLNISIGQAFILAGTLFVFIIIVSLLLTRLYRRTSKELAYVRTGFGGEKVILDGGALVLPILQEICPVNMLTLRLEVDRKNEEGMITADRMRVDVKAEFYVRVKPESEAIAKAAQTLGNRTMQPDTLKELLQGKFVDSLRSVAAGLTMEQLHERRAEFIQSVQASVSEDLLKNGLELESVSLTGLDQTSREYFKEDNAFDAQGLAKLTQITEAKREERNRIEQETRIKIETKNLEAAKLSFEIKKNEEFASLNQKREVEIAKAQQEALIAQEQSERKRQAEQARIESELRVKEAAIASHQTVQERDVASRRAVEEAEIARQQSIDTANQEAKIVIARKSEEQSKAEAGAAVARASFVREEEQVVTVRQTAVAQREKEIQLIKAEEGAQIEAVKITVAAQAEKNAAADRAEALKVEAQAQADKIRIVAEADHKRLEVEAYGEKAINEAKNILGSEIINFELRKIIAQIAPALVEASVKPMEKIDSIKILQANGFGGGGGFVGANPLAGGTALPNQLVDAALAYRMQLPLVDKMLGELGLDPKTAEGLIGGLTGTGHASASPAAEARAEGNGQASSKAAGRDPHRN